MTQNSTLISSDVAVLTTDSEFLDDPEEEEPYLPMYKCTNPRSIVKPELVHLNGIVNKCKENNIGKQHRKSDQDPHPVPRSALPLPKYPMTLMWNPAVINFELQSDRVVNRLRLFNSCVRPIYIQIYGLWDQSARLGASWCCKPRTRILLAPGMISYLAIIATPREESPIALAHIGLQLTATHMRDIVVGYFVVPVEVKFLNFKSINFTEESFNHSSTIAESNHPDSHHHQPYDTHDGSSKVTVLATDTEISTINKH